MHLKQTPQEFIKKIKEKIKEYNVKFEFEKAKHLSEYLPNVDTHFSNRCARDLLKQNFENEIFAAITPTKATIQPYDEIALATKTVCITT